MARTASTSAIPTRAPAVRSTWASGPEISQSRLGSTSAEAATAEPVSRSRRPTSLRHNSLTCSTAPATVGAYWRPTPDARFLPLAMPISSIVTVRPSLRPSASAMTPGARPRGCCPRSQRATEVLSYRRSSPRSVPTMFTRRARPALEQAASWMSVWSRSLGWRATSGLAAICPPETSVMRSDRWKGSLPGTYTRNAHIPSAFGTDVARRTTARLRSGPGRGPRGGYPHFGVPPHARPRLCTDAPRVWGRCAGPRFRAGRNPS